MLEQVDSLFDGIKTENIVLDKSSIRRHHLRVTNNHGADRLTIPSYLSYDGHGMPSLTYNVTLGTNYWIYLTLDSASLDDEINGKKTFEIHFIGLTKDNHRRFNVVQHTFHRVESDADEDMVADQVSDVTAEVEPDGTIHKQETQDASVDSQSVIPSKKKTLFHK